MDENQVQQNDEDALLYGAGGEGENEMTDTTADPTGNAERSEEGNNEENPEGEEVSCIKCGTLFLW